MAGRRWLQPRCLGTVEGDDRAGRERLLRYCARPPFALERLTVERAPAPALTENARAGAEVRRVLYRLPRAAPDGTTVPTLSPIEFLDALAHLIPPPRVHRHRYHGVLAPHARLRPLLTKWARRAVPTQPALSEQSPPTPDLDMAFAGPPPRPGRAPTATASPEATQPAAPSSQPSAIPANPGAPRSMWARDAADPEPIPEFEFDQTRGA